jgi:hypothetical protein
MQWTPVRRWSSGDDCLATCVCYYGLLCGSLHGFSLDCNATLDLMQQERITQQSSPCMLNFWMLAAGPECAYTSSKVHYIIRTFNIT